KFQPGGRAWTCGRPGVLGHVVSSLPCRVACLRFDAEGTHIHWCRVDHRRVRRPCKSSGLSREEEPDPPLPQRPERLSSRALWSPRSAQNVRDRSRRHRNQGIRRQGLCIGTPQRGSPSHQARRINTRQLATSNQHLAARAHHRRSRLVARALNPQNKSAATPHLSILATLLPHHLVSIPLQHLQQAVWPRQMPDSHDHKDIPRRLVLQQTIQRRRKSPVAVHKHPLVLRRILHRQLISVHLGNRLNVALLPRCHYFVQFASRFIHLHQLSVQLPHLLPLRPIGHHVDLIFHRLKAHHLLLRSL